MTFAYMWEYRVREDCVDAFRNTFRAEFEELDGRCEALTVEERCLGDFHLAT